MKVISTALDGLRRLWAQDRVIVIALGGLLGMVLASLLLPFLLPDPNAQDPVGRLASPSLEHWLGTDGYGRDILSRVVSAGRISLGLGFLITVLAIAGGTVIGALAGFYKTVSAVLMRLMDALLAFPVLVLAIALVIALGSEASILGETIALTVVFVPYVARVVRARTLELSQRGFVMAARAGGVTSLRTLARHVVPNMVPTILVQATFVYSATLLADASLSFLGLGVAPPTPTWGNMIAEAKPFLASSPIFIIAPGVAIILAVLAVNVAGDRIRALIDPRARANVLLRRIAAEQRKSERLERRQVRRTAA